jgi:phospholipid/cholesterol/gamma-HCH transport system permease protein
MSNATSANSGDPGLLITLGEQWRLLRLTVRCCLEGGLERGAVLRQMYEIGNRSLVFLCIVMGFIGMILTYQAGLQTQRVVPDLSQLGATFLELIIRDLAASICALMLATRVGAGIAAEIGSMVVTEQVDALHMCGADPIKQLVCPRFLASLAMFALLVVVAACVSVATGIWTASAFFGLNPRTFLSLNLVGVADVVVGLSKCFAYGAAIPIISAHAGLTAFGGSEGVGSATTRAVVGSSLAVIVLNFVLSALGYWLLGP